MNSHLIYNIAYYGYVATTYIVPKELLFTYVTATSISGTVYIYNKVSKYF